MSAGVMSAIFSWTAIIFSVLAALSTALALHYRTISSRQQTAEINSLKPRSVSPEQRIHP